VEQVERRELRRRLSYSGDWEGELPVAQAAFRAWTGRYLRAPSAAARLGLIAEGVELAQVRRTSMRALIELDPERALAVTVPVRIRQELPAVVQALLEVRLSGRGELALLAAVPAVDEPEPGPSLRRVVYLDGVTRTAFVYGRREEQLSKDGAFLHGIALDQLMAVHESPLRLPEQEEGQWPLFRPAAPPAAVPWRHRSPAALQRTVWGLLTWRGSPGPCTMGGRKWLEWSSG
jgi:hypothetical protein